MSKIQVDTIDTRSGTATMQIGSTNTSTINIGVSGDTVNIPAGVTIANAGTATGFDVAGTNSFFVKLSGAMSNTADNTNVKVTFDSEIFDTDSVFNTSNNRFVAPANGKYWLSTSINTWGQSYNAYQVRTTYYINGSETTYLRGALLEVPSSGNNIANVKFANSVLLNLSASDYVEVYSRSNNPDNSNTITIDSESTFMGFRIA